jgi:nuclear migration protein JNM1
LSRRLSDLRAQVATLEAELNDPLNPELQAEDINAGELMRSLIEVRMRLEKIGNRKEGRGRLVDIVTSEARSPQAMSPVISSVQKGPQGRDSAQLELLDRRVRELENLVGSSATTLDDVCFGLFLAISNLTAIRLHQCRHLYCRLFTN